MSRDREELGRHLQHITIMHKQTSCEVAACVCYVVYSGARSVYISITGNITCIDCNTLWCYLCSLDLPSCSVLHASSSRTRGHRFDWVWRPFIHGGQGLSIELIPVLLPADQTLAANAKTHWHLNCMSQLPVIVKRGLIESSSKALIARFDDVEILDQFLCLTCG